MAENFEVAKTHLEEGKKVKDSVVEQGAKDEVSMTCCSVGCVTLFLASGIKSIYQIEVRAGTDGIMITFKKYLIHNMSYIDISKFSSSQSHSTMTTLHKTRTSDKSI